MSCNLFFIFLKRPVWTEFMWPKRPKLYSLSGAFAKLCWVVWWSTLLSWETVDSTIYNLLKKQNHRWIYLQRKSSVFSPCSKQMLNRCRKRYMVTIQSIKFGFLCHILYELYKNVYLIYFFCFWGDVDKFCQANPLALVKDLENCAHYINCSHKNSKLRNFIQECVYPDLFSDVTLKCENFQAVVCKLRPEPVAPCKLLFNQDLFFNKTMIILFWYAWFVRKCIW